MILCYLKEGRSIERQVHCSRAHINFMHSHTNSNSTMAMVFTNPTMAMTITIVMLLDDATGPTSDLFRNFCEDMLKDSMANSTYHICEEEREGGTLRRPDHSASGAVPSTD